MTETSYKLVPSDYSNAMTTRWCWVEVTKEVDTFSFTPCRSFAVREDGDRVHLRGPLEFHRICTHSTNTVLGLSSCGSGCRWGKTTQNHLDTDDLESLADKDACISHLQAYLRKRNPTFSSPSPPDVYLTATPGTTTRKGLYCDPAYGHGGTLSGKAFEFDAGLASIASYIDHGCAE
jgi:hypothetical protein